MRRDEIRSKYLESSKGSALDEEEWRCILLEQIHADFTMLSFSPDSRFSKIASFMAWLTNYVRNGMELPDQQCLINNATKVTANDD